MRSSYMNQGEVLDLLYVYTYQSPLLVEDDNNGIRSTLARNSRPDCLEKSGAVRGPELRGKKG